MASTPDLIELLSRNLHPVRRWRPPLVRAGAWAMIAGLVLAGLLVGQGLRPDLPEKLQEPAFLFTVTTSILTATFAIYAAFAVCVPGRSSLWCLLPMPAVLMWMSAVGYQCLTDWVGIGPDGVRLGEAAHCMATMVLASLPLGLALALLLRLSPIFRPRLPVLLGSLAVAGVTSAAMSLMHAMDASAMILIFNVGVGALMVALGGLASIWGPRSA